MARTPALEKMSYADLTTLRAEIDQLIVQKQAEEKVALKAKLTALAAEQGFDLDDVLGKGSRKRAAVAIKYRDPDNAENTWTGRGRQPRWLVAALKKRGTKIEDFLV